MQDCAAGYALTYLIIPKLQLVRGMVVGLTAAKFKPLYVLCIAPLCPKHVHLDLHGLGLHLCPA
jgi:hypothetical protein